ncbi:MAG: SoxY-related AACIE arm protein [Rubrivivax sp.]|jgi:sulfur-oxidizing protein SoxY
MTQNDASRVATRGPQRRALLAASVGAAVTVLTPAVKASPQAMEAAIRAFTGGREPTRGGVRLEIPELHESGNAVPVTVSVDSPMTEQQHVRAIALFNERNPQPDVAVFHLSPHSGRARVVTRIRLGDTQQVVAVAQMSDGSFRSSSAEVIVTLPACVETS